MTTALRKAVGRAPGRAPWALVSQAAAALAASMGIGRFAYSPILPLMHAQAGLSAQYGSVLATVAAIGVAAALAAAVLRASPAA